MKKMIAWIKALKTRNKVFLSIGVLLLVLIVLGAVLPSADEEDEASTPEATPTEVSSSPTTQVTATPESTPIVASSSVTSVCPGNRENSGTSYTFNPDTETASAVINRVCGPITPTPTAEPVTGVCSDRRVNAGTEYSYNPDEETVGQAANRVCGEIISQNTQATNTNVFSAWDVERDGQITVISTPATSIETIFSYDAAPSLLVACTSADLTIGVFFPGGFVPGGLDGQVSVLGLFSDGTVYSGLWIEVPPDYEVVALVDEDRHNANWLTNLRNSDSVTIFVAYGDGENLEAEMIFDVRGFDRSANSELECY